MKNVSRFTRNGILNLLGWVVPILAQVATMPTIIRTVGTEGFGLLTIATSFIGYYTVFELGLGQSLTKIVSQYLPLKNYSVINSSISQALLIQLLIGLVGAGILVCFNQPLTKLFINESDPQFYIAKRLFLVVGFGIPATMVINPMQCVLAGMQRFDLQSSISGIFGIANSLGILFVVKLGGGIIDALWFINLQSVALFLVLVWAILRNLESFKFEFTLHRDDIQRLYGFGLHASTARVSYYFGTHFMRFMIGAKLGADSVTYYTIAQRITAAFGGSFNALTSVAFPDISEKISLGQKDAARKLLKKGTLVFTAFAAMALIPVAIFSSQIINFWFGSKIVEKSAELLSILCISQLLNVGCMVATNYFLGIGRVKIVSTMSLLNAAVVFGSFFPLSNAFGLMGAGLSLLLGSILSTGIFYFVRQDLKSQVE